MQEGGGTRKEGGRPGSLQPLHGAEPAPPHLRSSPIRESLSTPDLRGVGRIPPTSAGHLSRSTVCSHRELRVLLTKRNKALVADSRRTWEEGERGQGAHTHAHKPTAASKQIPFKGFGRVPHPWPQFQTAPRATEPSLSRAPRVPQTQTNSNASNAQLVSLTAKSKQSRAPATSQRGRGSLGNSD